MLNRIINALENHGRLSYCLVCVWYTHYTMSWKQRYILHIDTCNAFIIALQASMDFLLSFLWYYLMLIVCRLLLCYDHIREFLYCVCKLYQTWSRYRFHKSFNNKWNNDVNCINNLNNIPRLRDLTNIRKCSRSICVIG